MELPLVTWTQKQAGRCCWDRTKYSDPQLSEPGAGGCEFHCHSRLANIPITGWGEIHALSTEDVGGFGMVPGSQLWTPKPRSPGQPVRGPPQPCVPATWPHWWRTAGRREEACPGGRSTGGNRLRAPWRRGGLAGTPAAYSHRTVDTKGTHTLRDPQVLSTKPAVNAKTGLAAIPE